MKLVLATKNKNKVREITDKFSGIKCMEILSLLDFESPPDILEDGKTFRENALKKARGICRFTSLPSLADDSGLVIDALGGDPGVYSARYGGENLTDLDRNNLVLSKMKGVPDVNRTARFVCVIAAAFPDGTELISEGSCEGVIADWMRGDNGFGYDPVFYLPERGKTMAELPLSEKNMISHRAAALESARTRLEQIIREHEYL
jgi:XTP/dITP diphosphohydrolase